LLFVTICSVFFLIVRYAVGGAAWAMGVSVGVTSLLLAFLLYGLLFGMAYIAALLFELVRHNRRAATPFTARRMSSGTTINWLRAS